MITLETERMWLRPFLDSDVENLLKIFADPIAMEFYLRTKGEEDAKRWIARAQNFYKEQGLGFLACELKGSKEFVGACGLLPKEPEDGREEIEVGYLFVREFWGQGLATEAARGCMDYGFSKKGVKKIISLIVPGNVRSIRVAERNGLKREGEALYQGRLHSLYAISHSS